MGHRALVAYERLTGRYELHYAHWGAENWRLVDEITAETPRGQRDGHRSDAAVAPDPLATDCSWETILTDHVDFQSYEAAYRVTPWFTVVPYLVCWLGFPVIDTSAPGTGALVAIDPPTVERDGPTLRGRFEGIKSVLGQLVETGHLTPIEARRFLIGELRSWSGEGRTVHFGPGIPDSSDR